MSKQTTLAIDFGTSRTKMAYFDGDHNRPVLVDIGRNIRTMIPSAFYVPQPVDGKIDESKILVGDDAEDMLDEDPDGYVIAIKKEIHKTGFKRLGGGRKIERVELASYLFRYVKEHTESSIPYFINRAIDSCILTVPVSYSTIQREAIRQSAEKGGFRNIKIIEEPVAAACAWLAESHKQGIEYVIVCDIGGGTTDFAIVRFKNGIFQPVPEIPTKGFNWGGDDLDERILDRLHDQTEDFDDDEKQNYWQRITTNFRSAFKSRIRSIKEFLKKRHKEVYEARIQDIKLPIPQKEIASCVDEFVSEVCNELETYLKQCYEKLNNKDIPVLLVGGSSQLSGLEEKVKSIAGEKNVYRWANSEYAIVLGATLDGIDTKNIQTSTQQKKTPPPSKSTSAEKLLQPQETIPQETVPPSKLTLAKKQNQNNTQTHNSTSVDATPKALFNAVRKGNLEKVKELTNAGIDVNVKDKIGFSLLHYAAQWNLNTNILQYLISQGADVNVKSNKGWTPVHFAAWLNANIDVLKYLVSQGANIDVKTEYGKTPLDYAIDKGNREKIDYLQNLNGKQTHNSTSVHATPEALFVAVRVGNLEKIKELINVGFDVNSKDANGWTPLHHVVHGNKDVKILEYLISQGANVNIEDGAGKTPLYYTIYGSDIHDYLASQISNRDVSQKTNGSISSKPSSSESQKTSSSEKPKTDDDTIGCATAIGAFIGGVCLFFMSGLFGLIGGGIIGGCIGAFIGQAIVNNFMGKK